MDEAGQLRLINRNILVVGVLAVSACARSAPALPDKSYNDDPVALAKALESVPMSIKEMTCAEINSDIGNLAKHDSNLERQIESNRGKNQTAGYIAGVLFPPLILATEHDNGAKALLDENQLRRDHLIITYRGKKCPDTQ